MKNITLARLLVERTLSSSVRYFDFHLIANATMSASLTLFLLSCLSLCWLSILHAHLQSHRESSLRHYGGGAFFHFFAFNFRVVSCSFNENTAITITHHRVHGYQILLLQTVCLPTRVKRSGQEIQWAEVNVATVVLLVQKHKCQRKRGCGAPSTFPTDTYIIEPYHVTPTKSLAHQYRFIRCI